MNYRRMGLTPFIVTLLVVAVSCSESELYNRFLHVEHRFDGSSELVVSEPGNSFFAEYRESFAKKFDVVGAITGRSLIGIWQNQQRLPENSLVVSIGSPGDIAEVYITNFLSGDPDPRNWSLVGKVILIGKVLTVEILKTSGSVPPWITKRIQKTGELQKIDLDLFLVQYDNFLLPYLLIGDQKLVIDDLFTSL